MMKLKYLLFFCFSFNSCNFDGSSIAQKRNTNDTLHYSNKILKERANDCRNKSDSTCTTVTLKYPIFDSQVKLNDCIIRKIVSLLDLSDSTKTPDLKVYANDFFKIYEDERKNFPDWAGHFTLSTYVKIQRQDSSLTTLEIDGYDFQSGARGFSSTSFINWDSKANKNLILNDLFTETSQEKIDKIAESIFRKNEKISNTVSLAHRYNFEGGKFYLTDNFSITPKGIRFLYNETEIKNFAYGQTELFIPYFQIISLLKPNTVVAQYIK